MSLGDGIAVAGFCLSAAWIMTSLYWAHVRGEEDE